MNSPTFPAAANSALPLKDKTIRRVIAFFLVISVVAVVVAVVAVRNINRSVAASDWVNHTHAVILEVDGIFSAVQAGDAALRTFATSGEAPDRTAGREAFASLAEHLAVAKALTRSEPAQRDQVARIETMALKRAEFARVILDAPPADAATVIRSIRAGESNLATLGEIRQAVARLKAEEMRLLAERDTAAYLQAQTTRWMVWSGVALEFLLLAGVAWLIRDDLAARRRAATALEEANAQLEVKVRERTAELASTNDRLTAENLERRWGNQALEHQLRYNDLIVNSLSDLVFVLTKATNVSRVNPAVVHLTGLETSQLINQPLARFVRLASTGGEAPLIDPIPRALKEGHDLRDLRGFIEDKRGRKTPVRFTLFPLRDRDKVVGGVVILQVIQPAAVPVA